MNKNGNPYTWSAEKFPEVAVSFRDSLSNKTGSWRNMRPVIQDKYAPCTKACPTNTLIPQYFYQLVDHNDLKRAGEILLTHNPIPSITGRVCPHPCEIACNRRRYDEAISIRTLERYVGDTTLAWKGIPPDEETGKKVAIVGSGPAGMTAAYYLRKKGHRVVVYEKHPLGGGVLRYGIPDYRLPKEIVDREFQSLEKMGVEFRYSTTLGKDILLDQLMVEYDAVFLAYGAHKERRMGIQGDEYLLSGVEFLHRVAEGNRTPPGKKVAVVGGGNVAMDVIRTLLRIGANPVLLYRRTRKEMPALEEEIERALEDGIPFKFLTQPVKAEKKDGKILLTCIKMQLGEPDRSGRRRPVPIEGSEFIEEYDAVITAIGEYVDTSFLPKEVLDEGGWLVADKKTGKTAIPGLFAAGDVVSGPATVVEAIGWARRTAETINAYVLGIEPEPAVLPRTVSFKFIQTEYFTHRNRIEAPHISVEKRIKDYELEELVGYDEKMAHEEVSRCFLCGTCNSCGNCYVFCPDSSIEWHDDKPVVNYDYCKGCGVCAAECPRGIITMERERVY